MSMIKIENLTFSYPTSYDNVFENVSFQVDTDWKLGFVGRNGRGKTTFLNLLLGKYEYSGKILSSVQFDYFPYPVSDKNRITEDILQEICPLAEEWELMRELSYLDVDVDVLWRPFETLSNGEQTKVLIAALFLNEGHFLLIDEPTNHLDAKARKSVAAYLKKKKGFILVSHDRRFLDDCVDYILSINRANIEVQRGNFSSWMSNFERQQEFELAQNERLQKDIRRLQQSAKRAAVWSERVEASKIGAADKGYVGHKAAKMMKRSKSIEARQQQTIEQKSALLKNMETAEALKIQPLNYHTDLLASLSNVVVYYDGISVCEPVSFEIRQGERIVLDGKNGSGKSSLLKLVVGQSIDYTGKDKTKNELQQEQETLLSEIAELKVPLTEVQEDLKKLRDIRYWVRKATPGTEESKEPPKKQPIKEVLQDKTDEKKAQRTAPAQEKHRQQDMEL
ncbi:ATP-binding cassette domain-containing protein [Dorea formicigenerans]|uniref:ATP-binding cassette domain-containing protein n=1 Tax=Dorea formicigenerans TaxID=39486 RepID=UPI002ED005EE